MNAPISAGQVFRDPILVLATGFGSGLMPRAPGTAGSVVGVALWLPLATLDMPWQIAAVLLVALLGIPICELAARRLGVHDHPGIVWDEIAGVMVPYAMAGLAADASIGAGEPVLILAGFLLFRLSDILKPWPIGWLDRHVRGGLGIMSDDLLAGAISGVGLIALQRFILPVI